MPDRVLRIETRRFWESTLQRQLTALFRLTESYSPAEQRQYLRFLNHNVVPYLGPEPAVSKKTGARIVAWPSYMCDDHSTIEYSIAFAPTGAQIRLSFEPLAVPIPTQLGNLEAAYSFLSRVAPLSAPDVFDLTYFARLSAILVDANVEEKFTQICFGLDLINAFPVVKAYFFFPPTLMQFNDKDKAITERIVEALDVSEAWSVIASYHASLPEPQRARIEFVATDCIKPELGARLKLYVRYSNITRTTLARHLDLGGRINLPNVEGYAEALWDTFCEGQKEFTEEDPMKMLFYYDLRAGNPKPSSKIYMPVLRHCSSDLEGAEKICSLLPRLGVSAAREDPEKFKIQYHSLLKELYPHRSELGHRSGGQTHMCIAFKAEKGSNIATPEVSIYFNAEIYAPEFTKPRHK